MSDLSPRSRAVLENARPGFGPSPEARKRMREAVLERVAHAGADTGAAGGAPHSGPRLTRMGNTGKLVGLSVVALIAGFSVSSLRSSRSESPPVSHVETPQAAVVTTAMASNAAPPEVAVVESAAALPDAPPTAPPAPVVVAQARKPAESAATKAPAANGIEDEYRLIDTAYSALSSGKWDDALSLIDTHAQRFPNGQLAQQRERLRVEALVAQGHLEEARSAAALFRQRFPNGILRPSVERALAR